MPSIVSKKVLLVEGNTEKRLIPYLMEQRDVNWEGGPGGSHVVRIDVAGGPVTAPNFIGTQLKESALGALGVVFDADSMDGRTEDRWGQIKRRCGDLGIDLPDEPAPGGYIITLESGVRFGVWMMPDNRPPGMLETFLLSLLSAEEAAGGLFRHAQESLVRARELGALYREVHKDKALVHTWLAWQDQPGAQLHEAIKFRILDANSPNADGFVAWFRGLFEV